MGVRSRRAFLRGTAVGLACLTAGSVPRMAFGLQKGETPNKSSQLSVSLRTERDRYRVGERIPLTLTLHNETATPVTLRFPDTRTFDFRARRAEDGEVVWQWSWGYVFAEVLTEQTLAPGETLIITEFWEAAGPAGDYLLESEVPCYEPGLIRSEARRVRILGSEPG